MEVPHLPGKQWQALTETVSMIQILLLIDQGARTLAHVCNVPEPNDNSPSGIVGWAATVTLFLAGWCCLAREQLA